jgi:hypothetical protein
MTCAPSARLEALFPNEAGPFAEEGAAAHALADIMCRFKAGRLKESEMARLSDEIMKSPHFSDEMANCADAYSDYVIELYNEARSRAPDAVLATEARLDLSRRVPGGFGTSDAIVVSDGVLDVVDLKYGKGVAVSAEGNKQLMLYALGALDEFGCLYKPGIARLTICQLRLGSVSTWSVQADELIAWADSELKEKAALAFEGAGDPVPGPHCRFCRAKAACRALAEDCLGMERLGLREGPLLSSGEMAEILSKAGRLKAWAESVSAYALRLALAGRRLEGWKLVKGRSARAIVDQEGAAKALSGLYAPERYMSAGLKGVGELERLMGKKAFAETLGPYLDRLEGKPALAPVDDKREEWLPLGAEFGEAAQNGGEMGIGS